MKIALTSNTSWSIFNFRIGLINELLAQGHQVVIVSPLDQYISELEKTGCEIVPISIDNRGINPLRDVITFVSYWNFYRNCSIDLVLNFTIKPVIYSTVAARLFGIPIINTLTGLGTVFTDISLLTFIVEKMYSSTLKYSRYVFCHNDDDKNLLMSKRLAPDNIVRKIGGSGVNLKWFKFHKLPENAATVFLMVSRLLIHKGVREYIEAAQIIKNKYPAVKFQVLGPLGVLNRTAISRTELQEAIDKGSIEYYPEVRDVRSYIIKADCIVLPSYREGLPRSLLEAGAIGRPVIATDVPGCREVIQNGDNGFLCKAQDHLDLTNKLESFLQLPRALRENMARAGRLNVEHKFSETVVIAEYMDSIDKCVSYENQTN